MATTTRPNKGDTVEVTIRGTYSHKGAYSAAGRHVIKGDNGQEYSVPGDAVFTVVRQWQREKPEDDDTMIHNQKTGKVYRMCSVGCCYIPQGVSEPGQNWPSWATLLAESNNGRSLVYYRATPE